MTGWPAEHQAGWNPPHLAFWYDRAAVLNMAEGPDRIVFCSLALSLPCRFFSPTCISTSLFFLQEHSSQPLLQLSYLQLALTWHHVDPCSSIAPNGHVLLFSSWDVDTSRVCTILLLWYIQKSMRSKTTYSLFRLPSFLALHQCETIPITVHTWCRKKCPKACDDMPLSACFCRTSCFSVHSVLIYRLLQ